MQYRLISLTAAGVLGASTLFAQAAVPSELTRVEGPRMTVGEAFARMRGRAEAKVVTQELASPAYLIPAAGSVPGSGGTYFRSDFSAGNIRSTAQRIGIGWLAQGVDNRAEPLQYFTIPASQFVIEADVVADLLGKSGLGSIMVFGQTASNQYDADARLMGFSRIWTNQPGASGTVSLQFPAVWLEDSEGTARAYAIGLRHDGQYRTNVGIVNLDVVSHTWTIRIRGVSQSADFTVTVLPFSMRQVALPAGNYGDHFLDFAADAPDFPWSGYGASVDNETGDGWVSKAIQP